MGKNQQPKSGKAGATPADARKLAKRLEASFKTPRKHLPGASRKQKK